MGKTNGITSTMFRKDASTCIPFTYKSISPNIIVNQHEGGALD